MWARKGVRFVANSLFYSPHSKSSLFLPKCCECCDLHIFLGRQSCLTETNRYFFGWSWVLLLLLFREYFQQLVKIFELQVIWVELVRDTDNQLALPLLWSCSLSLSFLPSETLDLRFNSSWSEQKTRTCSIPLNLHSWKRVPNKLSQISWSSERFLWKEHKFSFTTKELWSSKKQKGEEERCERRLSRRFSICNSCQECIPFFPYSRHLPTLYLVLLVLAPSSIYFLSSAHFVPPFFT